MLFDFQPTLEGTFLILRPLRTEDFGDLYSVASDPLILDQHPVKDRYKESARKIQDTELSAVFFSNPQRHSPSKPKVVYCWPEVSFPLRNVNCQSKNRYNRKILWSRRKA
jgi:hypothetical protein